jgi:hypothetical protein
MQSNLSPNTLIRTTVRNNYTTTTTVVVHNKIEHEKYFVAYGGSN